MMSSVTMVELTIPPTIGAAIAPTTNCFSRLFAKKWNQRECSDTIEPPPSENSGRSKSDH